MLTAINAPTAETIQAGTEIIHQFLKSINFFFAYMIIVTTAIGTKTKRLIHCAIFCGVFIKSVTRGIKKVPPPIPIPANKPDTIAIKINHKKSTIKPPSKSLSLLQQS